MLTEYPHLLRSLFRPYLIGMIGPVPAQHCTDIPHQHLAIRIRRPVLHHASLEPRKLFLEVLGHLSPDLIVSHGLGRCRFNRGLSSQHQRTGQPFRRGRASGSQRQAHMAALSVGMQPRRDWPAEVKDPVSGTCQIGGKAHPVAHCCGALVGKRHLRH